LLNYGDMTDATNLIRIVQETQPDEICNLAAQSHVQVSFETAGYTTNALVFLMQRYSEAVPINVGSGKDVTILELARLIMRVVSLDGGTETDRSRPEGTPRKLMDNSRLKKLGWAPSIPLEGGIRRTYAAAPFGRAAA
jgi:nucleoside-diphosphate-sugar epimerase